MNMQQKRGKKSIFSAAALFLMLMLAACAPSGGTEPAADADTEPGTAVPDQDAPEENLRADLQGEIWLLAQMGDTVPPTDAQPTLEFTADGVAGNTGCNSFFGQVSLEGESISFSNMGMTEMYCDGLMEQESAYLAMLAAVHSYSLNADELILHTDAGDMIYRIAADAELEGTEWVLGGISTGNDAIVHMMIDQDITMQLVDGAISGSGGCNSYSGSYTVTANDITVGDLVSTLMACADQERNDREAEFLSALSDVASFEISRSTLNLFDAEGKLLLNLSVAPEETDAMEDEAETITLFVGPERVPCEGVAPQECYRVKRSADGEWELFYDEIAGFEWETGFEYELKVQVTTREDAPADASALQYELLEVISQKSVE
jgi:heat shock protein HslJ